MKEWSERNVYGRPLRPCCYQPLTGYFRDGFCRTNEQDHGIHTVCIIATKEFLEFSRYVGNDLMTPRPEFQFPGIKPKDQWCLCAQRWLEAYDNEAAPHVVLESTHEKTLQIVPLSLLEKFSHLHFMGETHHE